MPTSVAGLTPKVLVRRSGDQPFTEPTLLGYAEEIQMQEILLAHPTLLPGIEDPAVACREFQSGAGPADVVVVDGAGSLTVTECKLAQNPQVRREVVGQVVDYASRIWRMPIAEFERRWVERTGQSPFDSFGDADAVNVREGLSAALDSGRFAVVLAVDGINDDLRRMVEYLNAVTVADVQVLAFEIARVQHHDVEILLPRVFGAELATVKAPSQPSWTEQEFLEGLRQRSPEFAASMSELITQAHELGLPFANGTAAEPNLIIGTVKDGSPIWSLSLFSGGPHALSAVFRLDRFIDREIDPAPAAARLLRIPGVTPDLATLQASNYRRWIKIPMDSLSTAETRQLLIEAQVSTDRAAGAVPPVQPPESRPEAAPTF